MYYQLSDGLFVSKISLYTDEWVEAMNATLEASSSGQVLLCDIPVRDVLGMNESEVIQAFGEPEVNDSSSITYRVNDPQWLEIWFDSDGKVDSIYGDATNFTYQGQSLYQDQDVIIELLGNNYQNLGGAGYGFECQWILGDCCFVFGFPKFGDDEGRFMAQYIAVWVYE